MAVPVAAQELPTVTWLVPNQGAQNVTLTGVQINGTNLTGATAVTFTGAGVTAAITGTPTATQITATITITSSATLGPRDVTVTTPGGTSTALVGGFTVVSTLPAPTVTWLFPSQGVQGATLTGVQINGTNLTGAALVSFTAAGVTASAVTPVSATQVIATIAIAPTAATGAGNVTVTTPGGTSAPLVGGFSVTAPQPTVTSVVPNQGVPGAILTGVQINGTNLTGATAVSFGAGVTAAITGTPTATQITATITIDAGAVVGPRDVTVTTSAGAGTLTNGFFVYAPLPPTVTSVVPNQGAQNATLTGVLINGTNLWGASLVTFSGTLVTASAVTVVSATQITATITIGAGAVVGPRDVTVTTPGGTSAPLAGGFTVTAPLPTVTSLVPNQGVRGATLTGVQINGTNLTGALAVTFTGAGVDASAVTVVSATRITATITITSSAALGARNVTVTATAGTSTALVGGFTVIAEPEPTWVTTILTEVRAIEFKLDINKLDMHGAFYTFVDNWFTTIKGYVQVINWADITAIKAEINNIDHGLAAIKTAVDAIGTGGGGGVQSTSATGVGLLRNASSEIIPVGTEAFWGQLTVGSTYAGYNIEVWDGNSWAPVVPSGGTAQSIPLSGFGLRILNDTFYTITVDYVFVYHSAP
jgi:uncharacterized protein YjbI with pentapeptide repeats